MSDIAIQVEGVWKKFRRGEIHDSLRELIPAVAKRLVGRGVKGTDLGTREFWALQDVSFEVKRGESLGIIGPNGAGKSTMLKMLSRILKPNRGQYRTNGRLSALIEVGAGFHGDLTGRENIYLNGSILGMKRGEIRAKEEQIIDFAGIPDFIDTPVKRYSSGMAARLGFSVAAHMEPDILLVDEVLSVGDARFRSKCIDHMQKLINSDVTVVFISHILEQVRSLCPRTIVLNAGRVEFEGDTPHAILKYLSVLEGAGDEDLPNPDAELSDIRFCSTEGVEVPHWTARQPGVIAFDYIVHRPLNQPQIQINFHDIAKTYLGTASNPVHEQPLPNAPGRYQVSFTLDPVTLTDGEYSLRLKIVDHASNGTNAIVWRTSQNRTLSVRGSGIIDGMMLCDGDWQIAPSNEAPAFEVDVSRSSVTD